jgi:processive 1,2-diacylglycerol beta-glucosyltransferase
MLKILSLQRESNVSLGVPSLSVSARITELLEFLKSMNSLDYISLSESEEVCIEALKWADILVLNKHHSVRALNLVEQAQALKKKIIYDVDDWIFGYPSYSGGQSVVDDKVKNIEKIISMSNVVTVANEELYKRLRGRIPSTRLLPNGIWIQKYMDLNFQSKHIAGKDLKIAFTNADYIKLNSAKGQFLAALQVYFLKHKKATLDFYGDSFPEIYTLPFLNYTHRLPYDVFLKTLINGRYTFSITPLGGEEDQESLEFNSCKNPFKYLNYGLAGIPGIYSRSPIYEKCIINGHNGLLIDNNYEDWILAMEELGANAALRNRISNAAFIDIRDNYNIIKVADIFMDIL